jgi:hypothetical protein
VAEFPAAPERQHHVVLVGTPHTGKTTFLALFYLALVHEKRTRLRLASWFGEREYLNEIADGLLSCTEANRTPMGDVRKLDLPLLTPRDDGVRLQIPDLSGELWQEALTYRKWPAGLDQRIDEADSKLVFVHVDEIDSGPSINAVFRLNQILNEGQPDSATVEASEGQALAEGSADTGQQGGGDASGVNPSGGHGDLAGRPPTQVDLLDLIQLTCEQRGSRPTRLGLVISAWDGAGDPEAFVRDSLPMLHQYLRANASWLESRIFGVSAQGGPFDDPTRRAELAGVDPVERAIVKSGSADADVGDIVEWAIGLD